MQAFPETFDVTVADLTLIMPPKDVEGLVPRHPHPLVENVWWFDRVAFLSLRGVQCPPETLAAVNQNQ